MAARDEAAAAAGKCGSRGRSGRPCGRYAGWGTPHPGIGACKLHGGCTPSHVNAANRVKAELAVITLGLPIDVEPQTALLEEVHRTAGHVAYLAEKIAEFDDDDQLLQTNHGPGGASQTVRSVWVDLYQAERGHLVKVCASAISAGVAERQVKLAEQQGALIAKVIQGVLGELGVADRPEVAGVIRRHLATVTVA